MKIDFSRASRMASFIDRVLNLIHRRAAIQLRSTHFTPRREHTVTLYVRRLIVSSASLVTLYERGV